MSDPGARPSFAERLADPLGHFPYKHDEARRAVGGDVLAEAEVDATAAYVEAQEAFLRNPSEDTRQAEREAARELAAARAERRQERERKAAEEAAKQDEEA